MRPPSERSWYARILFFLFKFWIPSKKFLIKLGSSKSGVTPPLILLTLLKQDPPILFLLFPRSIKINELDFSRLSCGVSVLLTL